jgi:acetyl esterase/lipase
MRTQETIPLPSNPAQPQPTELLWPGAAPGAQGTQDADRPALFVHLPPSPCANPPAVVICPGGGYSQVMMTYEGHDVAHWLNQHGIAGIVVRYRVAPYRHPIPLLDGQRALRLVRARARQWGLDPGRIGMMGFSAGGHLAASVATHFDPGNPQAADPIDRQTSRPDFLILVYPVITMGTKGHTGSRNLLLGEAPAAAQIDALSAERQVTAQTPPTFLAHAKTDSVVPVANSAMFYAALQAHGVPADYFELPAGDHGLGCGQGEHWLAWQTRCLTWLRQRGLARD